MMSGDPVLIIRSPSLRQESTVGHGVENVVNAWRDIGLGKSWLCCGVEKYAEPGKCDAKLGS